MDNTGKQKDDLKLLAAAFFNGTCNPLNERLDRLYDKAFFSRVARIEHQGGRYFKPIKNESGYQAVEELKKTNGLDWELPEQLKQNVATGSYKDPVIHPQPLVNGIDCKLVDPPVVVPPADLETECYDCGVPTLILAVDARKEAVP